MSGLFALRVLSWLEGTSLLALLFVAVPLKHIAGEPSAVRWLGSLHGLLFLMFALALLATSLERKWGFWRSLHLLLLSTLPFGVLAIERALTRPS